MAKRLKWQPGYPVSATTLPAIFFTALGFSLYFFYLQMRNLMRIMPLETNCENNFEGKN